MATADGKDTRQRILDIALDLFGQQGYAGTSIADIAGRLGTSKAALYYHFGSKSEIIEALLAGPLATYRQLVDSAGALSAEELLAAIVDTTAELRALTDLIGREASMSPTVQGRRAGQSEEINTALTAALAGPRPNRAGLVRAHAAYAAAKNGTLAWMSVTGRPLTRAERTALVSSALRALKA